MNIGDLIHLLLRLNHLIDCDFDGEVTVKEIDQHIETGDVLNWLALKFWGHFKLDARSGWRDIASGLQVMRREAKARNQLPHPIDRDRLAAWIRSPSMGTPVLRRRPEWEPQHNGICVLIACVADLIQRQAAAKLPVH